MSITTTIIIPIISSTAAVVTAASLLLEVEWKPKKKEKITAKATTNKQKQTSLKKLHNLRQHKNGANTPTKLIRLMEVTWRHA